MRSGILWRKIIGVMGISLALTAMAQVKPVKEHGKKPVDTSTLSDESLPHPGVPQGTLSVKHTIVSKVYDGMESTYWTYAPAQYDPKVPAALLVIQDGGSFTQRDGRKPILNAIDNLTAEHKIPVMILVLTQPGTIPKYPETATYKQTQAFAEKWRHTDSDGRVRSIEYDTVSDRYDCFLRDELLVEVGKSFNLRKDAYSRATLGGSSGGIAAFNAAWQMPDLFSRVVSWIGSFDSIQWKETPQEVDGGQDYPDKILREARRNIRVWLQDGYNDHDDLALPFGSWPLDAIRMANALHHRGYDYRFSFTDGHHSSDDGVREFPETMIWLWRGYDPAKTSEVFEQDAREKTLPPFRVKIFNRPQDPADMTTPVIPDPKIKGADRPLPEE